MDTSKGTDPANSIVDCTIRDGGLVNDWGFSIEFVQKCYRALNAAGVEYMEVGYKNSPEMEQNPESVGPWRFLDDDFLRKVFPEKQRTRLSAMADIGRVDEANLCPKGESVLDMIRVACYARDVTKGIDLVNKLHSLGYETCLNIMAVSQAWNNSLEDSLREVNSCSVDIVYVVDSFGGLYPNETANIVQRYQELLPSKRLGIHCHNNLQMALANTLAAKQNGATFMDASIYGMGRAAGNCPTELLLSSLRSPSYDVRPVLGVIQHQFLELKRDYEWGYLIPHAITGMLNEGPRPAITLQNSPQRTNFLQFYDQLTTEESYSSIWELFTPATQTT